MHYSFDYMNAAMREKTGYSVSFCHRAEKQLHCQHYKNAFVVPQWGDGVPMSGDSGGILTSEGHQVLQSVFIEGEYKVRNKPVSGKVAKEPSKVLYVGSFLAIYGNMITDGLKHLWYLYSEEGKEFIANGGKLVYTTIFHEDLPKWALEILELAGVPLNQCERVLSTTQYDEVLLPDPAIECLYFNERLYYKELLDVVNHITDQVKCVKQYDKVYFTRTQLVQSKDKDVCGEKEIEQLFRNDGYEIVSPETHSIREQIAILNNCNVFAATEGSISHNAIFCKPGSKHIILRKTDFVNSHQIMINELANLDVTYIDVNRSVWASKTTPWFGPFYMYVTPELLQFFGRDAKVKSLWLRTSWWVYYIKYSPCLIGLKSVLRRCIQVFYRKN